MRSFAEDLAIEEKQKEKEEALKRKTDPTDDNDGKDEKDQQESKSDSKGPKTKKQKFWIERDDKVSKAIRAWDT